MEPLELGPWPLGMDMCARDASLGTQLRLLVNLDVDGDGRLSARRKTQKLLDLPGAHSLTAFAGRLYGVHDGKVFSCVPGGAVAYGPAVSTARMCWGVFDSALFGVSRKALVCIGPDHTALPWGSYAGGRDADGVTYAAPTPADAFAVFGPHLLFAHGRKLLWTAAFQPQAIASRDFVYLPADVVLCAPVDDGVWIASRTTTWFLAGRAPGQWVLAHKADCGAIGADFAARDGAVVWLTDRGFAVGGSGGALALPQQDSVALSGSDAAVLAAPWDTEHYIAAITDPTTTPRTDAAWTDAVTF